MSHDKKNRFVNKTIVFCAILFAIFFVCRNDAQAADYYGDYSDVLLVINDNSADSIDIGNYFKAQRSIPDNHVVHISCTTSDDIALADFTTYIRTPIENFITTNGLTDSINYIVTTKGIPLRNGMGSVDSDLTMILGSYSGSIGTVGYIGSPYNNKREVFSRQKFGVYLVTRLTGYTAADAKALVDRATAINLSTQPADRGPFILDTAVKTGSYKSGDDWMKTAAPILQNKGYNVNLELTTTYLTSQTNVAGYCSWGSNDGHVSSPYYPNNTYEPGALAETYVSTSARSFTAGTTYGQSLIADWIAEGVTGVKGYVQEPYLDSMAHPDILFDRYTGGFNLADSYFMASSYIGRMDLIVGDPKAHIFEDAIAPIISGFSMPATFPVRTINVDSLAATDSNSPTASLFYLINESPAVPSPSDINWSLNKPAYYEASSEGIKTIYAWAMDSKGNISASASETVEILDQIAPIVQSFNAPSNASSLTVSVSLNAADNVAVTGYIITESSEIPLVDNPGWNSSAPTSYTFSSVGAKSIYAWTKDAAGNISQGYPQSVYVNPPDATKPSISVFSLPADAMSNDFSVPLILIASDNIGVTGYLLSESETTPLASDPAWSVNSPATYTFSSAGSKILHAWAKDAAGNVSNVSNANVTIAAEPLGEGFFSQSDWSGGISSSNANQSNKSGWNLFDSLSSVSADAFLKLAQSSQTITRTTETDFNMGSYSSTTLVGTGESASVELVAPFSTQFGNNFAGVPSFTMNHPYGVYLEATNNKIYLSDSHNRILKFDSGTGGTTLGANSQTFGNYGSGNGQFNYANGIYVDSVYNKIYVADTNNSRIVKMDSGGAGTTFGDNFETFGSLGSGGGQFSSPYGVFIDAGNNKIFITDTNNNRIVKMDSGSGGNTFGANFETFGTVGSDSNQFSYPSGITGDSAANIIYVADRNNSRIIMFDSGGGATTFGGNFVSTGSYGTLNGQFKNPSGIQVDLSENKIFVNDSNNSRIIRMGSGSGGTIFGDNFQAFGKNGSDTGQFFTTASIFVDSVNDKAYVADITNERIAIFDSGGGDTIFGNNFDTFQTSGSGRGQLKSPSDIYVDSENNKIYLSDNGNNRIVKMDSGAGGTTLGENFQSFGMLGSGTGQFNCPDSIYVDVPNDKIYVSDQDNSRIVKMNAGENSVFGSGFESFGSGGTGLGQFYSTSGIFLDGANNKLYIVDIYNERIVKMDSGENSTIFGGNFSTYSGMNSYFEDGWYFNDIFVDTVHEKVYVADNGMGQLYKFDSGGASTDIPGTNLETFVNATMGSPGGVFVDVVANKIYATNMNTGGVIKFDSGEGGTTLGANIVSFAEYGNEQRSLNSRGIFVDHATSKIFVADKISDSVVIFDSGENTTYPSAGLFTSDVVNAGTLSGATLSWNESGSPSISMKVRSATSVDGLQTKLWDDCTAISSGMALASGGCSNSNDTYLQFQAYFSSNGSTTPSLNDITLIRSQSMASGELVSSWFDSGFDNNVIDSFKWSVATSVGNSVSLKLQTAPDGGGVPGVATDWLGPDSTNATSFTHADGSDAISGSLAQSRNNRWLRYKVSFVSDGIMSSVISNVSLGFIQTDNIAPSNPGELRVN